MTPATPTLDPARGDVPMPPSDERPVFAAADGRRARRLRLAGRIAVGLAGLWLIALLAGALGFGHLPGVNLPRLGGTSHHHAAATTGREAARDAGGVARSLDVAAAPLSPSARRRAAVSGARTGVGAPLGVTRAGVLREGAARRGAANRRTSGSTGSSGTAALPTSATTTQTGQRVGQTRTTSAATTTPAATGTAPGQARKLAPTTSTTAPAPSTAPGSSGTTHGQARGHTKTTGG